MRLARVINNSAALLMLDILSKAMPLVVFPVMVRALGPTAYGKVGFATAVAGFFGLLASPGFTTYAAREAAKDEGRVNFLVLHVLGARIAFGILSYALLIIRTNARAARLHHTPADCPLGPDISGEQRRRAVDIHCTFPDVDGRPARRRGPVDLWRRHSRFHTKSLRCMDRAGRRCCLVGRSDVPHLVAGPSRISRTVAGHFSWGLAKFSARMSDHGLRQHDVDDLRPDRHGNAALYAQRERIGPLRRQLQHDGDLPLIRRNSRTGFFSIALADHRPRPRARSRKRAALPALALAG